MFAVLNSIMVSVGAYKTGEYGTYSMINLSKINELHQDISAVAGYMMMLIPFLANGFLSRLGDAFGGACY